MFAHFDSSIVYRLIAVASKPFVLIILTTFYNFKYAIYFSAYIILSQSLINVFHSNLYRKFYDTNFNQELSAFRVLREFLCYIRILKSSFLYFGFLVAVILISYLSFVADESDLLWLSLLMLLGIFADKIFAEQIRYQNFSGNSKQTSLVVLFSGSYIGVLFLVIGGGLSQWLVYVSLLALLAIYFVYCRRFVFTKDQRSLVLWSLRNSKIYSPIEFFRLYKSKIVSGQMATVMSANVATLDRHVYTLVFPAMLPAMTFLSQIGSVLVLYIDLFKIFKDRPRYIKRERLIFNSKEDVDLLLIGSLYCLSVPFVWYLLEIFNMVSDLHETSGIFLTLYMLVFPCYAMSRVGMEIIWWKSSDSALLYLEIVCVLGYGLMLIATVLFWPAWTSVIVATLTFSVVRFGYIIMRSRRVVESESGA